MILIADRNEAVRGVIREAGLDDVMATEPDMASALARRLRPEIVILSRWRDVSRVRRASPNSAIFLMTDAAGRVERIAAFACGVSAYVVRAELDVLVGAIEAALEIATGPGASSEDEGALERRRFH